MPDTIEPICENCGLCCSSYTVWMTNRSFDDDPKEIKRLMQYHGIIPQKNTKGELGLHVPIPCEHLGWKDGKSFCKINSTKPIICKEYFCGRIIEKALEEAFG